MMGQRTVARRAWMAAVAAGTPRHSGRSALLYTTKAIRLALCAAAMGAAAGASDVTVRPQDTGEALINPGMGLVHYHY